MSRHRQPEQPGIQWVVADLATGVGIADAVAGVDAVVHLASAPYKGRYTARVDVEGTRTLVTAARDSGVDHLVYTAIVGQDQVPWPYFRRRTEAEAIIKAGGIGWSIMRITQFHEFVDAACTAAAKLPVLINDRRISGQPVDIRDVTDRLLARIADGPSGQVEDFGGPEILSSSEILHQWMDARSVHKRILNIRIPGKLGRAFSEAQLVPHAEPRGQITWSEYLHETSG